MFKGMNTKFLGDSYECMRLRYTNLITMKVEDILEII